MPPKYYVVLCTTVSPDRYDNYVKVVRCNDITEAKLITNRLIRTSRGKLDNNVKNNPVIEEIDFKKVNTINNTK